VVYENNYVNTVLNLTVKMTVCGCSSSFGILALLVLKGTVKRRMLMYGQKMSQDVSYMTSWDETDLSTLLTINKL